jgi:hypothetical protein
MKVVAYREDVSICELEIRRSVSGRSPMAHDFKVGDHVEWNSEAGRVRGTIKKKHTAEVIFKGYTVHASKEEPQYLIKSDTTDHLAMHKGSALKIIAKVKP